MRRAHASKDFRLFASNLCLGILPASDFSPKENLIGFLCGFPLNDVSNAVRVNVIASKNRNGFVILQKTMDSLGDELDMLSHQAKTYFARYAITKIFALVRISLSNIGVPDCDNDGSILVIMGMNYDTKMVDVAVIDFGTSEECASIYELLYANVESNEGTCSKVPSGIEPKTVLYSVLLEVFEENDYGSYRSSPRTKEYFRLRRDTNNKIRVFVFNFCENLKLLKFKDCESFEVKFLTLENFVPLSNIVLEAGNDGGCSFRLTGDWNASDKAFDNIFTGVKNDIINGELQIVMTSPNLQGLFAFTVPLVFCLFEKKDRFWSSFKWPFHSVFSVQLQCVSQAELLRYKVDAVEYGCNDLFSMELSGVEHRTKNYVSHLFATNLDDPQGDLLLPALLNEETVASGTEFDTEEIPTKEIFDIWDGIFRKWDCTGHIPMDLYSTVREFGIQNHFRPFVWKRICNLEKPDDELSARYHELLKQNSEYEKVITPDVRRTFPLHPYFNDQVGKGQQALFSICKAYSLYDQEVGYCQGMSFIAAVFLLQADELTAFAMFVKLMYHYNLRELYKASFEALQEEMYVIRRHLAHTNSKIDNHFTKIGVEPHMYMPQWILTCFTAKFPLSLANIVMDNLLLDGPIVITKFALAIIQISSETLKSMTFDEVMRYFRVSMPRLYYSKVNVLNLLKITRSINLGNNFLEAYKVDYMEYKMKNYDMNETEAAKCENRVLFDRLMRMEAETDVIAQELISTQFTFQNRIAEDECKIFELKKSEDELQVKTSLLERKLKEKTEETEILVDSLQNKMCDYMDEISRKDQIISQYKNICKTLEDSSNKLQLEHESMVRRLQDGTTLCSDCIEKLNEGMEKTTYVYHPMDTGLTNAEAELVYTKVALADAEVTIAQLKKHVRDLENKINSSWLQKWTSSMKN